MKHLRLLLLSAKYLVRYRRRYLLLFAALSFGFGFVTMISAVKDGMYGNVYNSAQDHYAGDIIAVGYDRSTVLPFHLSADGVRKITGAAESSGIKVTRTVKRTLFGDRGMLYYNGAAVRLKYITGVDWGNEAAYFDRLLWAEPPRDLNDEAVLLSAPVAAMLSARSGDLVTLEVETRWGQKNTGTFIVGGIINDSTIFGYYKVYVSRAALNRLTLLGEEECGMVGFYVADRNGVERQRRLFQAELEKHIQTGPIVHDRDELQAAQSASFEGIKVFIITIPVYLSEVADILGAMNLITRFLYGMMLVIIFMSALVTYRLVLHERRKELGTMRAIGFYGADLRFVLILEISGLALLSLAAGMVLAFFLQWTVTFIPLSWFPSFEIFLRDGKLAARYVPGTMIGNVLAVFAALLFAAVFPVWKASREPLPAMLGGA